MIDHAAAADRCRFRIAGAADRLGRVRIPILRMIRGRSTSCVILTSPSWRFDACGGGGDTDPRITETPSHHRDRGDAQCCVDRAAYPDRTPLRLPNFRSTTSRSPDVGDETALTDRSSAQPLRRSYPRMTSKSADSNLPVCSASVAWIRIRVQGQPAGVQLSRETEVARRTVFNESCTSTSLSEPGGTVTVLVPTVSKLVA